SRSQAAIWRDDVSLFQRVLELDPESPRALNELGIALATRGRWDEAREVLGRAVRTTPQVAMTHFNLGKVLEHRGETDAAIREYGLALDLDPAMRGLARHLWALTAAPAGRTQIVAILERARARGSLEARRVLADSSSAPAPPR